MCRHFEYEFEEGRNPLNEIADNLFPRIEEIFSNLMANNSIQSTMIKNKIAKILYISNQLSLCNRY